MRVIKSSKCTCMALDFKERIHNSVVKIRVVRHCVCAYATCGTAYASHGCCYLNQQHLMWGTFASDPNPKLFAPGFFCYGVNPSSIFRYVS